MWPSLCIICIINVHTFPVTTTLTKYHYRQSLHATLTWTLLNKQHFADRRFILCENVFAREFTDCNHVNVNLFFGYAPQMGSHPKNSALADPINNVWRHWKRWRFNQLLVEVAWKLISVWYATTNLRWAYSSTRLHVAGLEIVIAVCRCTPPEPEKTNLLLKPGLAFGTGEHPTTRLCLQWLARNDVKGKTVIDYGAGSGILTVAALIYGAAHVVRVHQGFVFC